MVMQRTPTKAARRAPWWWGAAAAAALGLALYGWGPHEAQAEGEAEPTAAGPAGPAQPTTAAAASAPLVTPAPSQASAASPWVVAAASSVTRRVRALPLALPEGASAPVVPWEQGVVELVAKRSVEVAGGRSLPLVTLRDPSTGQLHYRLSVLRVELKPGTDALSLVQALPGSRLDFSNQVYALIEVEPEQLAAAYRQLQGDPRVQGVALKAYTPLPRPK